jgi:LSM domain
MKNGEIYRGLLVSAEETMNMSLAEVLRTARNGQITKLQSVYLRGSSVRFIALPELLKNAPVFQKVATMKRKMEQAQQQQQGMYHWEFYEEKHSYIVLRLANASHLIFVCTNRRSEEEAYRVGSARFCR